MSNTSDRFLCFPLKLSSLSRLFNNPAQTWVNPLPPATLKSITTHLCQCRRDFESGALSCPHSPKHQWTCDGEMLGCRENLHEIKFSTWLTSGDSSWSAGLFLHYSWADNWLNRMSCLFNASSAASWEERACHSPLQHTVLPSPLNLFGSDFVHPSSHTSPTPKRHLQFTSAHPSASVRLFLIVSCLKISLNCHLDVTPAL